MLITLSHGRSRFALGLAALFTCAAATANEWPSWRGPEQTGMTREPAPVTTWDPSQILWQVDDGGRTTPIVLNNRVYAIMPADVGTPKSRERVVCWDADTGKQVWEHRFPVYLTDIVENRVGWTSLAGDPESGNIYAHGTGGDLICYDRDGKILWKHSLTEEFGRISGYGGRLMNPVIDENRVILNFLNASWGDQAKGSHRYVAFDKKTGEQLWWSAPGGAPEDTTYATPTVALINGQRMLIAPNADGQVYGINARTGEKIWSFDLSKRGLNTTPVVRGNYVYVSHSEENIDNTVMGRVVCIDASGTGNITKTHEVWRADGLEVGYCSPAIANDRLYVITNNANMYCLDAESGKPIWEHSIGRVGKGSPVVTADGVIYVGEQNGVFHILRDAGEKCETLATKEFSRDDGLVDEFYGSPAVANGRVYFMTRYGTYCLGSKKDASLAMPVWDAFEKHSRETASEIKPHPSGQRVRKLPAPPFTVSFDDLAVDSLPAGWVGVGGKTKIVDQGGNHVLMKMAPKERPSPPFMRVRGFATEVFEGGLTVQCDLMGTAKKSARKTFVPDMGVMATRYRCFLTEEADESNNLYRALRVDAWDPIPRFVQIAKFDWLPETWYTVKVEIAPGANSEEVRCRAKVWPRDATEPAEWMINAVDPAGNHEGAAGIYGYSNGTKPTSDGTVIYYDNFRVARTGEAGE